MARCFAFSGPHDILIMEVERLSKEKMFLIGEMLLEVEDYENRGFWKEDIEPEAERQHDPGGACPADGSDPVGNLKMGERRFT